MDIGEKQTDYGDCSLYRGVRDVGILLKSQRDLERKILKVHSLIEDAAT